MTRRILTNLLLVIGGTIFGIVLVIGLMSLYPLLTGDRYARSTSGLTMNIEFQMSDGDMFVFFPDSIRPPEPDYLLETYSIAWDANGWRVPKMVAETYPIAAFGDSFTEAPVVPLPWTDILAETLGIPVANYGYRGYGPVETAKAAEDFAGKQPRTWVLYTFFAGNDLNDINRAEQIQQRDSLAFLPFLLRQASTELTPTNTPPPPDTHYDYPMGVIIGDKYYDMVLLDDFLWAQRAPLVGFEGSHNYKVLSESLDRIEASAGKDACLGFIFIPTKEQLYYPYVHEGFRRWLRERAQRWRIDVNGRLDLEPAPFSEDQESEVIAEFVGQRDTMAALVATKSHWQFIDLLPGFETEVAKGELLYYQYDTHWNEAGHHLAAQIIAEALQNRPDC